MNSVTEPHTEFIHLIKRVIAVLENAKRLLRPVFLDSIVVNLILQMPENKLFLQAWVPWRVERLD